MNQPNWSLSRYVQEASMLELIKWLKHTALPSVGLIQSTEARMKQKCRGRLG